MTWHTGRDIYRSYSRWIPVWQPIAAYMNGLKTAVALLILRVGINSMFVASISHSWHHGCWSDIFILIIWPHDSWCSCEVLFFLDKIIQIHHVYLYYDSYLQPSWSYWNKYILTVCWCSNILITVGLFW